jgi:hypothetical protein
MNINNNIYIEIPVRENYTIVCIEPYNGMNRSLESYKPLRY